MLHAVLKLQGDDGPCGEPAAPSDHTVTKNTGELGLLIVSLRPGCKQVARIHRRRRGHGRVHRSEMAIAQQYSDALNIYNQSG